MSIIDEAIEMRQSISLLDLPEYNVGDYVTISDKFVKLHDTPNDWIWETPTYYKDEYPDTYQISEKQLATRTARGTPFFKYKMEGCDSIWWVSSEFQQSWEWYFNNNKQELEDFEIADSSELDEIMGW